MIGIVAGHGGSDHGCESDDGELFESQLTLPVAAEACRLLGTRAYLVRTEDLDLKHYEALGIAKRAGCSAALLLHFDSGAPARNGAACFYRVGDGAGRQLGVHTCAAIGGDWRSWEMPNKNFPRASDTLHAYAPFPAALVEIAFLSSPIDCARLKRDGAIVDLAERVAKGVESYLSTIKEPPC